MDAIFEAARLEKRLKEATGVSVKLVPCEGEGELTYRGKSYMVSLDDENATKNERLLIRYILQGLGEEKPLTKEESLRSILFGESEFATFRFMTQFRVSDKACCAVVVYPDKLGGETYTHVERCIEGGRDLLVAVDDKHVCIVKFLSDEQSPYEFASFLFQSLYEELGVRATVGVGEAQQFSDISRSYRQAVSAVRMSRTFRTGSDVHMYRDFMLVRMLGEVPKISLEEYFAQFGVKEAEEVFKDGELLETAERFLECNLNVSETSRVLFMHRNTLLYRLDKIENATGLNIRNFSDAVTFRILAIIYKLLNQ